MRRLKDVRGRFDPDRRVRLLLGKFGRFERNRRQIELFLVRDLHGLNQIGDHFAARLAHQTNRRRLCRSCG